ncbi:C39 family peptidase [Ureibacillus acetophenoni]|uniref:Peptidase C39-like protein n=1 Tax=Ureibacillus acetophenoni TaxID=614649 RepID=A0A285UGW7_9BACL|nr:C39 family peptidase [Ureibacillus acetophenoni]SOC41052.1 peptidase C39-like protein [Ureibacillus acetophenoni]
MSVQLNVTGCSQYDKSIHPNYQNSACGPTTIYVILNYLNGNLNFSINELYKKLGGTKIGLFRWRLIKNLRKLLGSNWKVSRCSLNEALEQLDQGRPVAMKFDRYFTFQWKYKSNFKYHWVPLIGYEIKNNELYLILHDNGWKNRDSQIRKVRYADNYKVLSYVKIEEVDA